MNAPWPIHLTPGAFEARRAGCTCSMIQNNYGRGYGSSNVPQYIIAPGCELHDPQPDAEGVRRCERCGRVVSEGRSTIHEKCLTPSELRLRRSRRVVRARGDSEVAT